MSSILLERIQQTGQPVVLPPGLGAGRVSWLVRPGQVVSSYESLGVLSCEGVENEITAPVAGRITALMVRDASEAAAGQTVAYIAPTGSTEVLPIAPQEKLAPAREDALPIHLTPPPPQEDLPHAARRSTLGPTVEELTLPPPTRTRTRPPAPSRERVKLRGYYVLPSQERAIKRLVADLSLSEQEPLGLNESEVLRAAIDLLLSLPDAALRATLERYKDKERVASVGSGWPRPGQR